MARIRALITPSVLKWARVQAGYGIEEASEKLGIPVDTLEKWEGGNQRPTLTQARDAARIYRRPLAAFYLPKPPVDFQTPRDFRRLPTRSPRRFSPEMLFLVRTLVYCQEWLGEYRRDAGYSEFSAAQATQPANAAAVANAIRATLGIGVDWYQNCKHQEDALRSWTTAAEAIGICVRRDPGIELTEVRGLALCDKWAPLIWINSKDTAVAQLFTLAHELAHIWRGESGVSNLSMAGTSTTGAAEIEVFCNQVAANLLVAPEVFEREWQSLGDSAFPVAAVTKVAGRLKISEEVVARLLLSRHLITNSTYQHMRNDFTERWRQRPRKKHPGGPDYATLKISQNGQQFTREVLSAYFEDYTTATEASDLLGLKVNHFPKVASKLQLLPGKGIDP